MTKKAQSQQIFIFILAAVVMGAVLLLGVRFVGKTMGQADQAVEVNFINDVKSMVESMEIDFGSVEKRTFKVPKDTDKVCIIDRDCFGNTGCEDLLDDALSKGNLSQILIDEAELKENNFFIVTKGVPKGYDVGDVRTYHEQAKKSHQCFQPIGGRITIGFEGVKGGVDVFVAN